MARMYVPIFFDWTEVTVDLTQEQKGNLIDAVVDYASERRAIEEIAQELAPIERVAFRFMRGQIDRNFEISSARSKAASNKPEQKETKTSKPEQKETKTSKFIQPTVEEVRAYCTERGNSVDPQQFVDFYSSKGWKVGSQAMKDWKASVRTWEQREKGGKADGSQRTGNRNAEAVRADYSFLK